VRAKRECDPELCLKCDAKNVRRICKNCDIQRGDFKPHVVSRSKWGFGVFLSCSLRRHDFIAEYVGELVRSTTYDENRQFLADYRGRNYLYELNKDVGIDAVFAGNHTRFINHSDKPNCCALVLIVNSEFRIGIYAARSMTSGTELLLDYGSTFFKRLTQTAVTASNFST